MKCNECEHFINYNHADGSECGWCKRREYPTYGCFDCQAKLTKTEKLKQAYHDLKQGKYVMFIPDKDPDKPIKGKGVVCWIDKSRFVDRKYIFWQYFGSSANRMGLSELRWIAKVIGECTTYDYKLVNNRWGD